MSKLQAINIQKSYKGRAVVRGANLEVEQGEVIGLLGPNGAGKTTCFYMIVGLVPCDAGQILLDNKDITHDQIHKRAQKGIGYLPQEASVFRKLSVEDNILAILQINKSLAKRERADRLKFLLEEFQLKHIRKSLGMSLSGGERRRVEIARTLALNPKFILLDEPFAGIDPISVTDIQGMVKKLAASKVGILITDHNVRETLNICNRSYILGEGKIIAQGGKQEILGDKRVKSAYLGENFSM